MTTSNRHLQQGKILPLILIIVAAASISLYWLLPLQDKATITSDPQSLNAIGWGDDERELKQKYTGRGTTIASLGFRVVGEITGCGGADDQALQRRGTVFANAATGIESCTVSAAGFRQAQKHGDTACLDAIESAADKWQKNWSSSANQPYEFRDVGSDVHGLPDGRVGILDKVHTIERLAGWPVGDPVPGHEASPTVWAGDYNGWRPADYADSCPVEWVQCFDRKAPLYSDVPGLEALGAAEGQCIVEIAPDQKPNPDLYGGFDVMREVAPDVKFVIAAFRENREDSMSRSADWLIENQRRFNIVAARTSNIMLLETRLLSPGLQALCAGEAWCDQAGHVPYRESCTGNPYDGGKAYAHHSVVKLPDTYKPIAWQYERMRDAGIAAIKGAGHEGWKGALPYPDCSPALVSVAVAYAGHMPRTNKPEKLVENGWIMQGWRWHPDGYCEEQSITPDQITCISNNAPGMGYELPDGTIASPLVSIHPNESMAINLGNAWTTPYVAATVALLKSDNLAPDLPVTAVMDLIHRSGVATMDTRSCDRAPEIDDPDGWLYADLGFFDMQLAEPGGAQSDELSEREQQLLQHPWAYSCTDSLSPDTAPFHMDNVPDYSNRRLNIGGAVRLALKN